MSKVFVIDIGRCTGCYCCQIACKDEHCGNDWSPYAKPQPDTGQFWLKIDEHIRGTIPKVKMHYLPHLCNHCENAACITACPHSAIYKREDGLVIIDPEKCEGCKKCVDACAYDAVFFNDELKISQKCTGCAHLIDTDDDVPRCVQSCTTECLQFGEEEDLADLIKDAVVLKPETGAGAKVYYRNIPGRFIAGTVYDPVEKDVITGAVLELSGIGGKLTVKTDGFGDFWFKDLPEGAVYDLVIKHDGFPDKTLPALSTKNDINLGDIPLR
ncbi:MAG: carboxypeptidase regulatory-like domain-containing protein [Clostridiales Family XIII bacterium]|jgi:Fe-S-cluster-containing dehydrogenase component|nr:carboxypeptidase regulatory-like domain-containing protein [Clostridiales Family XIII bacterium]